MTTEFQFWIPAQSESTRVKLKNFRPFYGGKSLIEIKLQQICKHHSGSSVYLSGDIHLLKKFKKKFGVNILERPKNLNGNKIKQANLLRHFFENTPESRYVGWVQVTDPFWDDFGICNKLNIPPKTSIVVANELRKHVFYKDEPVNFCFGDWHKVTQDLNPIVVPRWSSFFHRRIDLKTTMYQFGIKIKWLLTEKPMIDIDTLNDFQLARLLFKKTYGQ